MSYLVIGDITTDTFLELTPSEAGLHCDLKSHTSEICFQYAQKIPVSSVYQCMGGNAANIAVGLTRLGEEVILTSQIGNDSRGEILIKQLKTEGVNTSNVLIQNKEETNLSTVLMYRGEKTIFTHHVKRAYELSIKKADIIYLTSLGDDYTTVYDKVITNIGTGKLYLQPGTIQIKDGYKVLKPYLERTDMLLLNKDEGIKLTGVKGDEKPAVILKTLSDMGPKEVVMTDNENGVYLRSDHQNYWVGIWQEAVRIESTGVGDAFSAAYIVYRKNYDPIKAAMAGAINAGRVIGQIGAQKGLLSKNELEPILKRAKIRSKSF